MSSRLGDVIVVAISSFAVLGTGTDSIESGCVAVIEYFLNAHFAGRIPCGGSFQFVQFMDLGLRLLVEFVVQVHI